MGHVPVLLNEVVAGLAPRDGDLIVDGTLGGGGYTRAILQAADCRVIGIDHMYAALDEALRHGALAAADAAGEAKYPGFHNADAVP